MSETQTKKDLVKAALTAVMRPLVRMMLRYGLPLRELHDVSKKIFYEEGCRLLNEQGAKITHSQLSVLTGLHRKDITEFISRTQRSSRVVSSDKDFSVGAAIIAEWSTNTAYLDAKGQPKPLPYIAEGDEISFSRLVQNISKDVRAKSHLSELQRLGIVHLTDDQTVVLDKHAFLPNAGFAEKLSMFKHTVGDHIAAASENIATDPPPFFDRFAFHGELSEADIVALRKVVDDEGMALMKKIYRLAEEHSQKSVHALHAKKRMSFGMYFFHAPSQGDRDE